MICIRLLYNSTLEFFLLLGDEYLEEVLGGRVNARIWEQVQGKRLWPCIRLSLPMQEFQNYRVRSWWPSLCLWNSSLRCESHCADALG